MAGEEIGRVDEIAVYLLGLPDLDAQSLSHIVAVVTALCRMAGLTLHRRGQRGGRMPSIPTRSMTEECPREQALEIRHAVTRNALTPIPLTLVFVTRKAARHLREVGLFSLRDNSAVASDALAPDRVELEVQTMIEADLLRLFARGGGRCREHARDAVAVLMATAAVLTGWVALRRLLHDLPVTRQAAQALRLVLPSALEAQVLTVREADHAALAGKQPRENHRKDEEHGDGARGQRVRLGPALHRPPSHW